MIGLLIKQLNRNDKFMEVWNFCEKTGFLAAFNDENGESIVDKEFFFHSAMGVGITVCGTGPQTLTDLTCLAVTGQYFLI